MLSTSTRPPAALYRLRLRMTALAAALVLAGCAQLPDLGPQPTPKSTDAFQAAASMQAPQAQWPVEQWWTGYGDAQLNTLIAEALADAPDLAAAAARLQRAEAVAEIAGAANKPQVSANASVSADKLSYNHLIPRSPSSARLLRTLVLGVGGPMD